MVMNPLRVVNVDALMGLLGGMTATGALLDTLIFKVHMIASFQRNPGKYDLPTMVKCGGALESRRTPSTWLSIGVSEEGKVFRYLQPSTVQDAELTTPITCVGLALSTGDSIANAFAFLEFDEPFTIVHPGEAVSWSIEVGFNGPEFYMKAIHIPFGS